VHGSKDSIKSSLKNETNNNTKRLFKRSQTKISRAENKESIPRRRSSDRLKNTARNVSNFDGNLNLEGYNIQQNNKDSKVFLNTKDKTSNGLSRHYHYMSHASFSNGSFEEECLIKYMSPSREPNSNLLKWAKEIHSSMERQGFKLERFSATKPYKKLIIKQNYHVIRKNKLSILKQ